MEATLKNVNVLSVENNDFVNKEGVQKYFTTVYVYDSERGQVIELAIRDDNKLAREVVGFIKKSADVGINISPQKGGYLFFVNIVGISTNGKG